MEHNDIKKTLKDIMDNPFFKVLSGESAEAAIFLIDKKGLVLFKNEMADEIMAIVSSNSKLKKAGPEYNFFKIFTFYDSHGKVLNNTQIPLERAFKGKDQVSPFFCCLKSGREFVPHVLRVYPIFHSKTNSTLKSGTAQPSAVLVKIRPAKRDATLESMKNTFISFAAHQLKTPSSVVKGYLELLQKPNLKRPQLDHYVLQAYIANEQLIARSRNLLSLARIEGGLIEPLQEPVNADTIIANRISFYQTWLSSSNIKIKYTSKLPKNFLFISDPGILQEVIDVLLHNALKYSPQSSPILISTKKLGRTVVITIEDYGPGIKSGNNKYKYEKIDQSNLLRNQNNHGIGLQLAHQYAELIKSTIALQNKTKGSGVIATIRLKI